jgi:hypothetical protein
MWRESAFALAAAASLSLLITPVALAGEEGVFLPKLVNSSTVPASGDLNPYGVAFVPQGFPSGARIAAGDVLVSNFNNSSNVQGTGTTIIQLTPSGQLLSTMSATAWRYTACRWSDRLGDSSGSFTGAGRHVTSLD